MLRVGRVREGRVSVEGPVEKGAGGMKCESGNQCRGSGGGGVSYGRASDDRGNKGVGDGVVEVCSGQDMPPSLLPHQQRAYHCTYRDVPGNAFGSIVW